MDSGRYGICNGLGLLVHFLQHEVLITALFRCIRIPINPHGLLGKLFFIYGIELKVILAQHRYFLILHVVHGSGILQNGRHIGSDKAAAVILTHDQRTVL